MGSLSERMKLYKLRADNGRILFSAHGATNRYPISLGIIFRINMVSQCFLPLMCRTGSLLSQGKRNFTVCCDFSFPLRTQGIKKISKCGHGARSGRSFLPRFIPLPGVSPGTGNSVGSCRRKSVRGGEGKGRPCMCKISILSPYVSDDLPTPARETGFFALRPILVSPTGARETKIFLNAYALKRTSGSGRADGRSHAPSG